MKKFLLGTVGLVALGMAAPASAADLAARPYTKAPPMIAAVYDWSGFYVGVNGGWGSSRKSWDFVTPAGVFVANEGSHDATGGTVGGQIGYRWQASQWVFGLEAQGNWADFHGRNVQPLAFPAFSNDTHVDAFGLFTGQVGVAFNNALLYVKGGAAVTSDRYRALRDRHRRPGHQLGRRHPLGCRGRRRPGIRLRPELVVRRSNTITCSWRTRPTPSPTTAIAGVAGTLFGTNRISQDVDLVTARINYRWGGPVVAKY